MIQGVEKKVHFPLCLNISTNIPQGIKVDLPCHHAGETSLQRMVATTQGVIYHVPNHKETPQNAKKNMKNGINHASTTNVFRFPYNHLGLSRWQSHILPLPLPYRKTNPYGHKT